MPSEPADHASPDFLQRAERIFHQVLEAPQDQWLGLVEACCQGDAALKEELRSLLEAHRREEAMTSQWCVTAQAGQDPAGRCLGPYQLDRLLERGGMGAVYLAHRRDGQFEQQVAIKVMDLPLASDLFRERFRQERQILAGLAHPFITRLLDGGVAENGELFLVMEQLGRSSNGLGAYDPAIGFDHDLHDQILEDVLFLPGRERVRHVEGDHGDGKVVETGPRTRNGGGSGLRPCDSAAAAHASCAACAFSTCAAWVIARSEEWRGGPGQGRAVRKGQGGQIRGRLRGAEGGGAGGA